MTAITGSPTGTSAVTDPITARAKGLFVHVSDVHHAAKWYAQLLGLAYRPEDTYFNHLHVHHLEGGTDLLLDSKEFERDPRERPPVQCMFGTQDIDAAHAHALSLGAEIVHGIERPGPVSWFNFRDPDNNVHMVCQQHR